MNHNIKNHGHSVRSRLLNIANQTKQPFMKILPRYFQERLLYRLSISDYKKNFLLKGGALLYAHYNLEARQTIDIDFLGTHINRDAEYLKSVFREVMEQDYIEDGVTFDTDTIEASEITLDKEYNGLRLHFIAHLDTINLSMSMDIGFGDIVTPKASRLEYPTILENMPQIDILAYSLETVIAEKFEAMISLGEHNSRMKDFYDVYIILKDHKCNYNSLSHAIQNTFKNRTTILTKNHPLFGEQFFSNELRQRQWKGFMKKIKIPNIIDFESIGLEIRNQLKPIYDRLLNEKSSID